MGMSQRPSARRGSRAEGTSEQVEQTTGLAAAGRARRELLVALDETPPPFLRAQLEAAARSLAELDERSSLRDIQNLFGLVMVTLEAALSKLAGRPELKQRITRALVVLHPVKKVIERGSLSPPRPPTRSSAPQPNRRRAPRVEYETDVGFMSETNFFTGFSGDVSEGGLFVATYQPLPMGTRLSLSFVLPDGHQVTAEGRVAWMRATSGLDGGTPPGMGIRFDSLNAVHREAIEEYVRLRQPLFFEAE